MVGFAPTRKEPPTSVKFISAGLAACSADLVTFPLDTTKVRLQVQGEKGKVQKGQVVSQSKTTGIRTATTMAAAPTQFQVPKMVTPPPAQLKYRGLIGTLATIAREEGVRAWYNGLVAGLHRQMCFASVRIGLYEHARDTLAQVMGVRIEPDKPMIALRITAGIFTGGFAVMVAQPTDVVKVRMQADIGKPKRYPGTMKAYATIGRTEGIKGLWRGCVPNVIRNAVVNAAELVSYDLIKTQLLHHKLMNDNLPCHFVSAFCAGFITTVFASPVDVVKTRIMNAPPGQYRNILHCVQLMYKEAGFFGFYKGFVPNYTRLGSWNILTFVLFEQFKRGITNALDDGDD